MQAMMRAPMDPTGPDFGVIARECFEGLKPIFKTEGEMFIYAAVGHGAWEAALANALAPGDRVLVPETGNFSLNWGLMAEALGVVPEFIANDWRHAIDPAAVEARLAADREGAIKAVLMVHTDTATGITSDVPALRQAIDNAGHSALFMVDVIASLATTDFRMDEWQVDVAVGAAQKGLMMPPGLSFIAASQKALHAAHNGGMPRRYWDWRQRMSDIQYMWFGGTAPEHLIFALREAIDMVMEEGLEAAFARHRRLAGAVRSAVATWGQAGAIEFNAVVESERADSVTTILVPEGFDGEEVRNTCRDRFHLALGGGLGKLYGRAFRIGHMGDLNEPMVLGALAGVEAALKVLAIPHRDGGVTAAIDYLVADA